MILIDSVKITLAIKMKANILQFVYNSESPNTSNLISKLCTNCDNILLLNYVILFNSKRSETKW